MKKLNQKQSVMALSLFFGWFASVEAKRREPANLLRAKPRARHEAGERLGTFHAGKVLGALTCTALGDQYVCVRFGGPWGSWRGVIVNPLIETLPGGQIEFSGELTTGGWVKRSVPAHCPVHVHALSKA